jgi:hypothetical protein
MVSSQKRRLSAAIGAALVALFVLVGFPSNAVADVTKTIVAGTGVDASTTTNEVPARSVPLWNPSDVAAMPNGDVVFADTDHHQVRRVTGDGIIHRFAGGDTQGCNDQGSLLWRPQGVMSDGVGGAYVANTMCGQIVHVDAQGATMVVAGHFDPNGNSLPFSDGMTATDAPISQPEGMAFDTATDSLYVAETGASRVLKVRGGQIWRVAGTGSNGYNGDGIPATSAQLGYPTDVAFRAGQLFIADTTNARVRMVDESGVIHTVAGTGGFGDSGDGGPADQATFDGVSSIDFSAGGQMYIASHNSGAIRTIDTANKVQSVSSLGACAGGISLDRDGNVYAVSPCAQYVYRLAVSTPEPTSTTTSPSPEPTPTVSPSPTDSPTPSTPGCPTLKLFGVRGSGEKSTDAGGYGIPVGDLKDRLMGMVPGMSAMAIDYPAIPVLYFDLYYGPKYEASIKDGIGKTVGYVQDFLRLCPTRFAVLVGYSQGGHVVGDAFDQLDPQDKKRVIVIMIGEPRFNPKQATVDVGTYNKNLGGSYWIIRETSPRMIDQADINQVRSYCLKGDPICNWSNANARKCAQNGAQCPHVHYIDQGYTENAAWWVLNRLG